MLQTVIVGIGGFVGSVLRWWLSGLVQRWVQESFPLGTLIVNALGCLVIGAFWSLVEYRGWFGSDVRLLISVGILGGFTTFSAFGYETFALLHDSQYALAAANVAANVLMGLAAVSVGWLTAKTIAT